MSQQVLNGFWAKKLNFENVLRRPKLRWKSRIPLNNGSKNQILLSNLTILMKIKSRKIKNVKFIYIVTLTNTCRYPLYIVQKSVN